MFSLDYFQFSCQGLVWCACVFPLAFLFYSIDPLHNFCTLSDCIYDHCIVVWLEVQSCGSSELICILKDDFGSLWSLVFPGEFLCHLFMFLKKKYLLLVSCQCSLWEEADEALPLNVDDPEWVPYSQCQSTPFSFWSSIWRSNPGDNRSLSFKEIKINK